MAAPERPHIASGAFGRVVDLGAGDAPDPRADETVDLHYAGADYQFDIGEDEWPFEDDSVAGYVANHCLEHVPHDDLPHVFEEAARTLNAGGWLELRVPLGCDADADPTHRSVWAWRTLDLYCDPDAHWIPTPAFSVEAKRLHVWMVEPLAAVTPLVRVAAKHWPHEAWYELPGATGELIALLRVES